LIRLGFKDQQLEEMSVTVNSLGFKKQNQRFSFKSSKWLFVEMKKYGMYIANNLPKPTPMNRNLQLG